MKSAAERFFELFKGLDRVHGYFMPNAAKPGEKVLGRYDTATTGPTVALWEQHLAGTRGLGVVPITDEATCVWGAIDVDVYDVNHEELIKTISALQLPLVVDRTKSGGAHLCLFLSAPASASLVRGKLMEWAVRLGHPGVEIFPKQTSLASTNDQGNWLNMPYFGGNQTVRYGFNAQGQDVDLEEYLSYAESLRITPAQLEAIELPVDEISGEILKDGPPCLQTLMRLGIPEGTRNNALFDVAVYLRKRYGADDWHTYLPQYAVEVIGLTEDDKGIKSVIKSVGKKEYGYKCKEPPISACCNRQICLLRQYGVGGKDDPGVVFGDIVKYETDPPFWIWDVNGARLELAVDELMDQRLFHKRVLSKLNVWPNFVKPDTWRDIVKGKIAAMEVVVVPEDATPEGQFIIYLQRFCTGRASGRSLDELLLGKAFTDKDTQRTYLRAVDLITYLNQQRFMKVSEKQIYAWMRKKGMKHHQMKLKGQATNCWSIAAFETQTESFDVPRTPLGDPM